MNKNNFNVRQMQAHAAVCLWAFCSHFTIKHDAITKLFEHLMSMLTTNSLPDWEQIGAGLDITGRGDPLPSDIEKIIPSEHLAAFNSLVECCVEVGIVDMYGASTEQPSNFLSKCIDILDQSGAGSPTANHLNQYRVGSDPWGEAISESDLDNILKAYGVNFS